MREIVFDTETTGLNPKTGDRLVEIGCVEMVNRCETGRTFHAWYHPDRDMPPEAEAVHGLSTRFLSDKPRFHEGVADLLDFIRDAPLIAHNATFDFGFLNAELALCGQPAISLTRMVDTLAIAKTRHPGAKLSLDALCNRYGIDRSHRVKHGALLDAQLLAQLYVELMGGRQIGLLLAQEESAPVAAPAADMFVGQKTTRAARSFSATPQELERHATFVAKLVDPLWRTEYDRVTSVG